MNGLSEIYTELIAEESRNPENRRHLPHRIADASFTGNGCAISQASASLMINLIKGQSVEKAGSLIALFQRMIKGEVTDVGELEELEDAAALQSISHMPARVKCALLSWRTLEKASISHMPARVKCALLSWRTLEKALDKPGRG